MNTGEIEVFGDDIRGIAVHAASRLLDLDRRSEVLISPTTRDLLEGSDLLLEDAGVHQLKGLTGPRQAYRLVLAKA
jgi:class 3 adenylate cyclase